MSEFLTLAEKEPNKVQVTTDNLKSLIQKYGIILIAFFVFNELLKVGLTTWAVAAFYPEGYDGPSSFSGTYSIVLSLLTFVINSIIAIVTLSDTRKMDLRWLIFFVTLVAPAIGVVFLLISKVIAHTKE